MPTKLQTTLLASLGIANYSERTYTKAGQVHKTRFAPVAAAALAGPRPTAAILVLTQEAQENPSGGDNETYRQLCSELRALGVETITTVRVGAVSSPALVDQLLDGLLEALSEHAPGRLVIDLTFGFRALPFVIFAGAVAAKDLFGIEVAEVVYAADEVKSPEKPLIDLTPALQLHDWYSAAKALQESGSPLFLARLIRRSQVQGKAAPGEVPAVPAKSAAASLEQLDAAMQECLPVEELAAAEECLRRLRAEKSIASTQAIGRIILPVLRKAAEAAVLAGAPLPAEPIAKSDRPLHRDWLRHQLDRITKGAEQGRASRALLALSEWLISRVVLARGEGDRWLERRVRQLAHRSLTAASVRERPPGRLYADVGQQRNKLAHAGMGLEPCAPPTTAQLAALVARAREGLGAEHDELWALPRTGSGRLLVTALGLSPGLLYSALTVLEPQTVLVITSEKGAVSLPAVAQKAGFPEGAIVQLLLEDPFTDYRAAERAFKRGPRDQADDAGPRRSQLLGLLDAHSEIVCNVTGGTSVLQVNLEWIIEEATSLDKNVRRLALIDRRLPEQQRADPWVKGEVVWFRGEAQADEE